MEKSGFTKDQLQEIEEGRKAGLNIKIYAKSEFLAIQMHQIRLGLEEGLDVSCYASEKYDWFQMEEIRIGLEGKLDVRKYADPSIPFSVMRQIRLGLEEGMDLSFGKKLPAGILRELRIANGKRIDIRRFIRQGYEEEQLKQIRLALERGIDIAPHITVAYRGASIREIALGLEKKLDISLYANLEMRWQQMREIRLGLEERLDVSCYKSPLYSWQQMREIRLGLEENLPVEEYDSLMYPAREMQKKRLELLEKSEGVSPEEPEVKKAYDNFMLLISADQMEANILVMNQGEKIRAREIREALREKGVTCGIDDEALEELETEGAQEDLITVARGKKSSEGSDGWYEYFFDREVKAKPVLLENGSVDYQHIKWFEMVEKDQKVAYYHEAEEGVHGYTLTGQRLPGVKGKQLRPLTGRGFNLLEDGKTYVSAMDGRIILKDGRLEITSLLSLGNITRATGNIEFNGSVYIKGSIGEGSVVQATGDILVDGYTEAAVLQAGGDIVLKKGNNAGKKGLIKAAGDVMGSFFENSNIEAGQDIRANYCLNSTLNAGKTVEISGRNGMLTGGNIQAGQSVLAYYIGNAAAVPTIISVGKEENHLDEKAALVARRKEANREITLLKRALSDFREKTTPETRNNNPVYLKIENAIYTKEKDLKEITEQEAKLEQEAEKTKAAKVVVQGTIYQGVLVDINGAKWKAKEASNVILRKKGNSVALYRNL